MIWLLLLFAGCSENHLTEREGERVPPMAERPELEPGGVDAREVLILVDSSCSMDDEAHRLALTLLRGIDELAALEVPGKVGVGNTHSTGVLAGVVSLEAADPSWEVAGLLGDIQGRMQADNESGLQAAGTMAPDFFTDGARHSVVIASDEPDRSAEPERFRAAAPGAYLVAIVPLEDQLGDDCNAQRGAGYIEEADRVIDLCDVTTPWDLWGE